MYSGSIIVLVLEPMFMMFWKGVWSMRVRIGGGVWGVRIRD